MAITENTENTNKKEKGHVLAGFVLYKDANIDWLRFKKLLQDDWKIECTEDVVDGAMVFTADGMKVACSLLLAAIPNKEAEEAARYNILWKEGAEKVAEHQAHIVLAIMDNPDPLDQAVLFVKVASCLLKLDNAIAIYKAPTCYEKDFYIKLSETIKAGQYPVPIMVFTGLYLAPTGLCAYTSGLEKFGYKEIEIVDSKKQPPELVNFLFAITEYVITEDIQFKDGETIGFTPTQKLPVKISDGVSVKGQTVKITF